MSAAPEIRALLASEEAAREYFTALCRRGQGPHCPRCNERRVYRLKDERLRCSGCRYTFHDFSGRWINVGQLTCRDWLRLLGMFAAEQTANQMAPELGVAYNTVYKALTALRFAVLAQALDGHRLLAGACGERLGFRQGRLRMERPIPGSCLVPVFGILEPGGMKDKPSSRCSLPTGDAAPARKVMLLGDGQRAGWTFVDYLPFLEAEMVFHFHVRFSLPLMRMGHLVYSDRYQQYAGLIFCGEGDLPYYSIRKTGRIPYLDSGEHGFWAFARDRLLRYKGVTARRFPLYLKELEFRYNHRDQDLVPLLAEALCAPVPNLD